MAAGKVDYAFEKEVKNPTWDKIAKIAKNDATTLIRGLNTLENYTSEQSRVLEESNSIYTLKIEDIINNSDSFNHITKITELLVVPSFNINQLDDIISSQKKIVKIKKEKLEELNKKLEKLKKSKKEEKEKEKEKIESSIVKYTQELKELTTNLDDDAKKVKEYKESLKSDFDNSLKREQESSILYQKLDKNPDYIDFIQTEHLNSSSKSKGSLKDQKITKIINTMTNYSNSKTSIIKRVTNSIDKVLHNIINPKKFSIDLSHLSLDEQVIVFICIFNKMLDDQIVCIEKNKSILYIDSLKLLKHAQNYQELFRTKLEEFEYAYNLSIVNIFIDNPEFICNSEKNFKFTDAQEKFRKTIFNYLRDNRDYVQNQHEINKLFINLRAMMGEGKTSMVLWLSSLLEELNEKKYFKTLDDDQTIKDKEVHLWYIVPSHSIADDVSTMIWNMDVRLARLQKPSIGVTELKKNWNCGRGKDAKNPTIIISTFFEFSDYIKNSQNSYLDSDDFIFVDEIQHVSTDINNCRNVLINIFESTSFNRFINSSGTFQDTSILEQLLSIDRESFHDIISRKIAVPAPIINNETGEIFLPHKNCKNTADLIKVICKLREGNSFYLRTIDMRVINHLYSKMYRFNIIDENISINNYLKENINNGLKSILEFYFILLEILVDQTDEIIKNVCSMELITNILKTNVVNGESMISISPDADYNFNNIMYNEMASLYLKNSDLKDDFSSYKSLKDNRKKEIDSKIDKLLKNGAGSQIDTSRQISELQEQYEIPLKFSNIYTPHDSVNKNYLDGWLKGSITTSNEEILGLLIGIGLFSNVCSPSLQSAVIDGIEKKLFGRTDIDYRLGSIGMNFNVSILEVKGFTEEQISSILQAICRVGRMKTSKGIVYTTNDIFNIVSRHFITPITGADNELVNNILREIIILKEQLIQDQIVVQEKQQRNNETIRNNIVRRFLASNII